MSWAAVEQLLFEIPASQVDDFFLADAQIWNPFLEQQPGFGGKMQLFNDTNAIDGNVTITTLIFWENYSEWKSISSEGLAKTYAKFAAAFDHPATPVAEPNNGGWRLYQNSSSSYVGCVLSNTIGQSMCEQQQNNNNIDDETHHVLILAISISLVISMFYIGYLHWKIRQLRVSSTSFQDSSNLNALHQKNKL